MKKYILSLLCCLFGVVSAMAFNVKGVVYEPDGEPAVGATVIEKGKPNNGVSTDFDGNFSINVASEKSVLVVSYIGYQQQEVPVNGKTEIEIHLKSDGGINLDEVVIVGYGIQKKINATGAVKTIDNAVLESRPLSNAVQGLQGAVAGLNITNDAGGGLGTTMKINIRGQGTIGDGSSGDPLILIDGMEGDLNTINPSDIENISILKDAASASIYGSRSPFGVILVTTKSGRQGTAKVNYTGNVRAAQPIGVPHQATGLQFALMMNDAYTNAGGSAPFSASHIQKIRDYMAGLNPGVEPKSWAPNEWTENQSCFGSTDWYDVHLKDVVWSQEHNVSVSGASDKINYYFSGNYLGQNGLFKYANENYKRLTLTGKVNINFNKYVSFQWTSRIVGTENKQPSALNGLFYHNLGRRASVVPLYLDPEGPAAGEYHPDSLIPALQDGGDIVSKNQAFYNQGTLTITPIKDWTIHVDINSRIENNPYTRQFKPIYQTLPDGTRKAYTVLEGVTAVHNVDGNGYFNVQPSAGESYYEQARTHLNFFTTNVYTDYLKSWGKNEFKFLLGMQTEEESWNRVRLASWDVQVDDRPYIPSGTGSEHAMISEKKEKWTNFGIFSRINYNYDNRYMIEVNFRADAASRFPKKQKWGYFPSVSVGWNIAQERFWEQAYNVMNTFKLRASYGTQGNQNTRNPYMYYQKMNTYGGSLILGNDQATILPMYAPYSESLTWERIENTNFGVDFGFLNNRLTGTFELYQRYTKDMVGPALSLAGVFGASAPETNNAELRTRGWELELSWRDRIGKDFNYSVSGTISDYKTVVTKYESSDNKFNGWYAGKNYGEIWGYKVVGIAKSDAEMDAYLAQHSQDAIGSKWGGGDIMYMNLDDDPAINGGSGTLSDPGDKTIIGNNTPRFAYSFTITAQWKMLDLRAYFQGIGKRDYMFSGSAPFYGVAEEWQRSLYQEHLDYFRFAGAELGANPDSYYGRLRIDQNNIQDCDRFLQDASYLRLKNLQIGVSLPEKSKLSKFVKHARLYVSAENLFTFTKLRIFDPEAVSGDWGPGKAYPSYRTYSAGIELTF